MHRSSSEHVAPGRQILIVEDDWASAELFMIALESAGHQVTWARNAPEALELLSTLPLEAPLASPAHPGERENPYDLIVLDLQLPHIDGAEMVRALARTRPQLPPIVLISALPQSVIDAATHSLPIASVLPKPFTPDLLVAAVAQALAAEER